LRSIADVRVAVALLFLAALATPRAPLVLHAHPGGGQAHAHAAGALAGLLGEAEHRHAPQPPRDRRPAYAADHGPTGAHVHQQSRFHTAVVTAAPFLVVAAPLAPLRIVTVATAPARGAAPASARAPPLAPAA
jgi:hypothetical protein